jgi:hypothetical protein
MPLDLEFVIERMAVLASRIAHPDQHEREYASKWLDIHWRMLEARLKLDQLRREEN